MSLIPSRRVMTEDFLFSGQTEFELTDPAANRSTAGQGAGRSDFATIVWTTPISVQAPVAPLDVTGPDMIAYVGPERIGDTIAAGSGPMSALGDRFWRGLSAVTESSDVPESTATPYSLQVGQSFYGSINSSTDEDWVAVSLVAGQTYDIRLLGMGPTFLTDPLVRIRDSSGVQVGFNDDGFTSNSGTHEIDSRLIFTAASTGTYYVEADAFSSETGDYLLTVANYDAAGMVFTADEIAWQLVNNGEAYFGAAQAAAFNVGVDNTLTVSLLGLTSDGQYLARQALLAWTNVTGITFQEVSGTAEITFDDSDAGTTAYANTTISGGVITSASVMLTTGWLTQFGTTLDSYSFETYIHEIGHALGLAHGGNYNGSADYGVDNYYVNDGLAWSIMSYMQAENDEFAGGGNWNTFLDASFRYMVTPQIADIIAIQYLYGPHTGAFTGDTTYGFNANTGNTALDTVVNEGALAAFTIYDSGGVDTMDFSGYGGAQIISLLTESMSSVLGGRHNVSVARGVTVENAIGGSGADTVLGNSANNVLDGGAGDDVLTGNNGDDRLIGGLGADTLTGGGGIDTADYATSNAGVTVVLGVSASGGHAEGDTLTGIENVTGSGFTDKLTGDGLANLLSGGGGDDDLVGGGGSDTLNGGVGADVLTGDDGDDTLNGGADNDVLVGGAGDDILNGAAGADSMVGGLGADQINGGDGVDSVSYLTSAGAVTVNLLTGIHGGFDAAGDILTGIENLVGSNFADTLTGDAAANQLTGGLGADTLRGGDGADVLNGGTGADTLLGDNGDDILNGGADNDTLGGGDGADTLNGAAGLDTLNGGAGNDILSGGGDADILNGGEGDDELNGGIGADQLNGQTGIDTASYLGTDAAVTVNLTTGLGSGGFAEGDTLVNIENIISGNKDDVLTGDGVANLLNGGGGNDALDGAAGDDTLLGNAGADVMNGAAGNDTLNGGTGADTLNGGSGTDILNGGADNDSLNGGADNDTLAGGSGDDIMEGGAGNDLLSGGAGADQFVFRGASGADVVSDFSAGVGAGDTISFRTDLFADFNEVKAHTANDGMGNCIISKDGVSITLTGVIKGDLAADDFVFVAAALSQAPAKTDPLTLPTIDDGMDPLILPVGLDSKGGFEDAPVICPPDVDGRPGMPDETDLAELGLAAFGSRGQHRLMMEPQGLDWII